MSVKKIKTKEQFFEIAMLSRKLKQESDLIEEKIKLLKSLLFDYMQANNEQKINNQDIDITLVKREKRELNVEAIIGILKKRMKKEDILKIVETKVEYSIKEKDLNNLIAEGNLTQEELASNVKTLLSTEYISISEHKK